MLQEVLKARSSQISGFKTRHNFLKDSFFPVVISQWNSLDVNIRNSSSINVFKKELLKFIRPVPNSTYNINDSKDFKMVYPHCVLVIRILKQQLTSSFTASIIIVQGKPSFTR